MSRPKGSKNKSKKHPSDRPELLEAQIEQNQLERPFVKITLKSVGRVFQSEAPTFEEAVDKIKISGGARSTSVLKLEKDGKETVKILNARYTNGLFGQGSPTMKGIYLNGVRKLFGI